MTCSPGFRPSRITHWLFCDVPTLIGRGAGLPSAPTTSTVSPVLVRVTACCGNKMPEGISACDRRTRTYWPGSSRPSGLGTSARSVIWPEVASTVKSENSSLPVRGSSEPSSRTMRTGSEPSPALRTCFAAIALRRPSTSVVDWVKFTYTVLVCWITASCVASA